MSIKDINNLTCVFKSSLSHPYYCKRYLSKKKTTLDRTLNVFIKMFYAVSEEI